MYLARKTETGPFLHSQEHNRIGMGPWQEHLSHLDLKAAFDSVPIEENWRALIAKNVPQILIEQ